MCRVVVYNGGSVEGWWLCGMVGLWKGGGCRVANVEN